MHLQCFKHRAQSSEALRRRKRQSGSVIVMFTLMVPFLLVPLVGLAIDATMMYSVRVKLQTAVDGGALAAAQSLNSGLTFTAQKATAETTADEFIRANFVVAGAIAGNPGFWRAYNLRDGATDCNGGPCIVAAQDDLNKRRTVSVSASVMVPLLFMRVLGFSTGTVSATGQAARRDVVLVLVLDRSSSMTPALSALKAGATYFVSQFQAGRDRLGLVAFGGSAIVAYPPTDWNNSNPAGPDTAFENTPDSSASPNILTSISNMAIGSNTGTAEALMLAYKELQAANQPGALNVIVLFTDGQPNGITANFNNNAGTSALRAGSTCQYKPTDGGITAHSMIGWMAQVNGFAAGGTNDGRGIFTLSQNDNVSQTSVTNWLKNGNEPVIASGSGQAAHNCAYASNQANLPNDLTIPTVDLYGNSTLGSGTAPYTLNDYKKSEIWGNECNNGHRANIDLTKPGDACQVGLASWNATDMAGRQIRSDTTLLPVIYCMGYEGNGGDDPALMQRLANMNVPGNNVYDGTKPPGLYLQIANVNDITPAFQSVLAEILRLSL